MIFYSFGLFGSAEGNSEQIRRMASGFSTGDWIGIVGGCLLICLVFGWLIRFIFNRVLPSRSPSRPTNTVAEAFTVILALQILGPVASSLFFSVLKAAGIALESSRVVRAVALTIVFEAVAVLLLGWFSLRREGASPFWDLSFKGIGSFFLVAPVVVAAFFPINFVVSWAWLLLVSLAELPVKPQEILIQTLQEGGQSTLFVFLCAVTVVPLLEEILFRGALYRSLKEKLGFLAAASVSAFLFALCHHNLAGFAPLFVLALFLAYGYERTGSLWIPILIHSLFNAANIGIA